jgi:hypothetical protein
MGGVVMARARNIKPGFFSNEDLVEMDFPTRLLFAGLWTVADRDGRLQDRPKKIKIDVFPADNLDIDEMLQTLHDAGFIVRYSIDGSKYIQISSWSKHQNPHHTEKASDIPPNNGELTVKQPLNNGEAQDKSGQSPFIDGEYLADSLIPDSLIPDSLIPDSLIPDSLIPDSLIPETNQDKTLQAENIFPITTEQIPKRPTKPAVVVTEESERIQNLSRKTWKSYSDAYFARYGTEPVRNAKINAMVKQLVARLGEESEHVSGFFVTVSDQYLLRNSHSFGDLLAKAESYRTQWATGRTITSTQARQQDQTASNLSSADQVVAMIQARTDKEKRA